MKNIGPCLFERAGKRLRVGEFTSIDRLSNLPDSLLHHILSFLDTKSAVQTSVLSQQWKSTWKHVTVLDFCSKPFADDYEGFTSYVDRVLSLRHPVKLSKVSVIDQVDPFDGKRECSLFAKVIKYALTHGTRHLAIDMQNNGCWEQMKYAFSDLFGFVLEEFNLETLELCAFELDIFFRYSNFRMLKRLELVGCTHVFQGKEVIDPFSHFPCLENLVMSQVSIYENSNDRRVLRISGLQLRSLHIEHCEFDGTEIYAPRLESFTYKEVWGFGHFLELTLPSLEYADICVDIDEEYVHDGREERMPSIISLFRGLHDAMSLILRSCTVQVLSDFPEFLEPHASAFTRLESLILEADPDVPSAVLNYFANGSSGAKPNVEFKTDYDVIPSSGLLFPPS